MWATARHILVDSEEKCNEVKAEIEGGLDFGEAAKANSTCPSSSEGGDLGKFGPKQMVPEFDEAIFSGDVGVLYGPIKTQFGYHLIDITGRG
ncbi:MAG: peptidylprolyl isomerase [Sulfurimonas sp.]|nr:peptidylprolyl isomerase [Sulfurimonas sp.]